MRTYIILLIFFFVSGCEDFVEKEPVDAIPEESAITDSRSAEEAVAELYRSFYVAPTQNLESLSDQSGGFFGFDDEFSLNSVRAESSAINAIWRLLYEPVVLANIIIDNLAAVEIEGRDAYIAEAKVIRAFHMVLLVQHWGDVPYSESPDYQVLQDLGRLPASEIYANLITDLEEASQDLPLTYADIGTTRTRFTTGGATALLARTHLYNENWAEAEAAATTVISNDLYSIQSTYADVFTKNSQESIMELWSDPFTFGGLGNSFLPFALGGRNLYVPTDKLWNAFETGDQRRDVSISMDTGGQLYISKYPDVTLSGTLQEVKVLRLAEIYLIRAEARAQQNDIQGAVADINVVRNRAGLPDTSADDRSSVLLAVEQERFVELAFEGHRWIDLVRTGRANEVMGQFNSQGWDTTDQLMPIPLPEIDLNANILPQNPGY